MNFESLPKYKGAERTHTLLLAACVSSHSPLVQPEIDFDLHLPPTPGCSTSKATTLLHPPPIPQGVGVAVCQICLIIDLVPGVACLRNRRDGRLTAAQTPRLTADSITHVTVNGPRWLMISCHVQSRAAEPAAGIKYRQAMDASTTAMGRRSLLEGPPPATPPSEEWDHLGPILHTFSPF